MSAGLFDIVGRRLGNLFCYPIDNPEVKSKGKTKGYLKICWLGNPVGMPLGCPPVCPLACPLACRPAHLLGNRECPLGHSRK
ncbi:MAG: hypothetical protein N2201_00450 [candidate division WOR-3 bacterium]|nr:hypothetical protein [candidate division WOR-3 bacterium]